MSTLVLLPKRHHSGDGYSVFRPEAERFVAKHDPAARVVEIEAIKMSGTAPIAEKRAETAKRRAATLAAFDGLDDLSTVAIFCHGWSTGMQLGFDVRTVGRLAEAISSRVEYRQPAFVRVVLYSCSCGNGDASGDGGFADALRDALCRAGVTMCIVDAHTTVGHATQNPFVRRFEGRGSDVGGTGGAWIVAPGSPLWPKWRRALRTTSMRLDYPFLDVATVHNRLGLL